MLVQWLFSTWQKTMVVVMLLAVGLLLVPQKTYALSVSTLVALTNTQRTNNGLPALRHDGRLAASAAAKAQHMIANEYWAHTAPDGTSPWIFVRNAGYAYVAVGENLAKDFSSDSAVIAAWMASSTHRANMLNPKFRDVGIAVTSGVIGGSQTTIVVAHYGATTSAPVSAAPTTTPKPTAPKAPTTKAPAPKQVPAPKPKPSPAPVLAPIAASAVLSQPPVEDVPAKKPYDVLIERLVGYIADSDKNQMLSLVLSE